MGNLIKYVISYDYYDRRHYRRTRELSLFNVDQAVDTINELKSKMGQPNGPIDVPRVVMFKDGEAKVLSE